MFNRRATRIRAGSSLVLAVALFILGQAGCAENDKPEAERSAPTSTLSPAAAQYAAHVVQGSDPERQLMQGAGNSMQTIYGDNTTFVIAPIAWNDLEAGTDVAYHDPGGNVIVHTLLFKAGNDAWVVKGYNNETIDRYYVTPQNLVGVVYSSFQSNASPNADQKAEKP